ncbi:Autophagy-related protein 18 [Cyberlindnera fabianii]|uniref:Autophagy-related protein 18 n=1 Tax=Cyberlindnera fabianii TaxID=36022 RepID=A0A1V2L2L9_CYBFA|nr:Autophagy-related protein 18 [Cyberlindnera fabianii]
MSQARTTATLATNEDLNFISFNQDGSCISIGTSKGYKIFNCEPFGKCYARTDGGIGIVEMLFSTSLIAIAGIGDQPSMSPRRLKIINTKRHSTICELTFPTTILAVKLNKSRLIVLLEEQIYIYDINNMRLLHTIETSPNPTGLCALSPTTDNNFLAYPSPPKTTPTLNHTLNSTASNGHDVPGSKNTDQQGNRNGDVIIFNAQTLQPLVVIEAHKTNLAAMAMSYDGTLLATASDKGTIVRVFSVETGLKLYQFRRGTYPTKIHSLSFSKDNKYLTASSSTATVHIFKLGDDLTNNELVISETEAQTQPKPYFSVRAESSSSDTSQTAIPQRRVSSGSFDSVNSGDLDPTDRIEPIIDISRRTVGRMIRKSSQNIGRRAAEKIGTYLPPKLTSMLEPHRHFASLKVPVSAQAGIKNVVSVGKEITISKSGLPAVFQETVNDDADASHEPTTQDVRNQLTDSGDRSEDDELLKLIHVLVVSSEGYFYNYGLDPERGGDCILLNQYLLVDPQ